MHKFFGSLIALLLSSRQLPNALTADIPPAKNQAVKSIEIQRGHVASYPRVFTGKITDINGKSVSDAVIEWGPEYPHDVPRETARSGEDGIYRLEAKKAGGQYRLVVSAVRLSPQWRTRLVPGPRSAPTEIDFKVSLETTLAVAIVDEAGQPIPNLEIIPMTPRSGFNSSFSMFPCRTNSTSDYDHNAICGLNVTLKGATKVWEFASNVCTPIISRGRIYWAWHRLHCLDFETGRQLWEGGEFGDAGSCLMTSDDRLIVYGNRGRLALVESADRSPDEYRELAKLDGIFSTEVWPHIVLSDGRLICKDRLGNLKCFVIRGPDKP